MVLYVGNRPGARGDSTDRSVVIVNNAEHRRLYRELGESGYIRWCREQAMGFIRQHPGQYARLVAKRVLVFWLGDLWRTSTWQGQLRLGVPLLRVKQAVYALVGLLAAAGVVVAMVRGLPVLIPLAHVLAYSVPFVLVYCGMLRYRVPIHGSLVLLSAVAVWQACAWVRGRRTPRARAVGGDV